MCGGGLRCVGGFGSGNLGAVAGQFRIQFCIAGCCFAQGGVALGQGLQGDFSPPRSIRVGTGFSIGWGLPVSDSSGEPVRRP